MEPKYRTKICSICKTLTEVYSNRICRDCNRTRVAKHRERMKSLGKCSCGRLIIDKKFSQCLECREYDRKRPREIGTKIDRCIYCKEEKEVYSSGNTCRQCSAIKSRERRQRNREKGFCSCGRVKGEGLNKCERCKDRKSKYNHREVSIAYYKRNEKRLKILARQRVKIQKVKVLSHYGGASCKCCKENNMEFLTLDHINGGGEKHRKEVFNVYRWVIKNNFPPGFQVLCMNCNFAKGKYGYCPHGNLPEALPPKPEDTEIPPLAPAPHRYQL